MYSILPYLLLAIMGFPHPAQSDDLQDTFPSTFLNTSSDCEKFVKLMSSHFQNSLKYLDNSKYYSNEKIEMPGLAKLLLEESDRHWEEGINVLKKYLHQGGLLTDEANFRRNFYINIPEENLSLSGNLETQYKITLNNVMTRSRSMVNEMTKVYHKASKYKSGDADLAHFLLDKTGKESDMAKKMAGHYITLQKMENNPIALVILDKNL